MCVCVCKQNGGSTKREIDSYISENLSNDKTVLETKNPSKQNKNKKTTDKDYHFLQT